MYFGIVFSSKDTFNQNLKEEKGGNILFEAVYDVLKAAY